jgi:hypothetical protein
VRPPAPPPPSLRSLPTAHHVIADTHPTALPTQSIWVCASCHAVQSGLCVPVPYCSLLIFAPRDPPTPTPHIPSCIITLLRYATVADSDVFFDGDDMTVIWEVHHTGANELHFALSEVRSLKLRPQILSVFRLKPSLDISCLQHIMTLHRDTPPCRPMWKVTQQDSEGHSIERPAMGSVCIH